MTKSRSPLVTCWLSLSGSSTMWPLTLGAIPTKLARTVASSVSARLSQCHTATATATTAPARMSAPTSRPRTRRPPEGAGSRSSARSSTEHPQPDDDGDQDHQPRVYERSRSEVRVDPDAHDELPEHRGADPPDHEPPHPRRKLRPAPGDARPRAPPRGAPPAGHGQDGETPSPAGTRRMPEPCRRGHATYRPGSRGDDG